MKSNSSEIHLIGSMAALPGKEVHVNKQYILTNPEMMDRRSLLKALAALSSLSTMFGLNITT
jgi:hypothetical protein